MSRALTSTSASPRPTANSPSSASGTAAPPKSTSASQLSATSPAAAPPFPHAIS